MHTPTPIRRSTRYGKERANGTRPTIITLSHFANGILTDICTVASVEYADDIVRAINSYGAMREALSNLMADWERVHGREGRPSRRKGIAMKRVVLYDVFDNKGRKRT